MDEEELILITDGNEFWEYSYAELVDYTSLKRECLKGDFWWISKKDFLKGLEENI